MFPWIISFITIVIFFLSKSDFTLITKDSLLFLSQLVSLVGTVLLSFTFLLSSRLNFLEKFFGPLDKIYKKHHLYGSISFLLLISHPLLLALKAFQNSASANIYLLPSNNLVYSAGVLALYSLIIFLILTLLVKLPYHLWFKTHQLMGVVLFFALIHINFINSDISRFPILKLWIIFWVFIAFISYLYKRFFYNSFGPKFTYQVDKIENTNGVLDIYLSPTQNSIKYRPGQFVFISFHQNGISKEVHPFTIASSPSSSQLRFCAKIVSDYTGSLSDLQKGSKTTIFGPNGQLYQPFDSKKNLVLIAGGIGVTPFISMIEEEIFHPQKRQINLFYTIRNSVSAFNNSQFKSFEVKNNNFKYHPIFTDIKPRLDAITIQKETPNFFSSLFILCGSQEMMLDLKNQLISLKINPKNIYYEDFSIK